VFRLALPQTTINFGGRQADRDLHSAQRPAGQDAARVVRRRVDAPETHEEHEHDDQQTNPGFALHDPSGSHTLSSITPKKMIRYPY